MSVVYPPPDEQPVRLQNSGRLKGKELNRIQKLVEENQIEFLEVWDEYFSE